MSEPKGNEKDAAAVTPPPPVTGNPTPPPLETGEGEPRPTPKDRWDKAKITAEFLVPVVILGVGFFLNGSLKSREVNAEYVDLAIQVLRDQDTSAVAGPLREWAVEILGTMGPVEMPEALREAIQAGEVPFPQNPFRTGARLEIHHAPELRVQIDGAVLPRLLSPEPPPFVVVIRWVEPGGHSVDWLSDDGTIVCSHSLLANVGDDLVLQCDPRTGAVMAGPRPLSPS